MPYKIEYIEKFTNRNQLSYTKYSAERKYDNNYGVEVYVLEFINKYSRDRWLLLFSRRIHLKGTWGFRLLRPIYVPFYLGL